MQDELTEVLLMLAEYYRETDRMTDKRLGVYVDALDDVPAELLKGAAVEWIRGEGKWFPKVSELREIAKRLANVRNSFDSYAGPTTWEDLVRAEHRLKEAYYQEGVFDEREWSALIVQYQRNRFDARAESLEIRLKAIKGEPVTGENICIYLLDRILADVRHSQPTAASVVCDRPAGQFA